MNALVLVVAAALTLPAAGPASPVHKVGVLPVKAGAGVDKKLAAAFTEATAGAVAKTGVEVVTEEQLKALLDHEAQKRLAGCSDDACMAQIGEALGVDALVTGNLAKVGRSWLFGLRFVDVRTGQSKLADRRLKGKRLDDVLDALPGMVTELVGPASTSTAPPGSTAPTAQADASGNIEVAAKGAKLAATADVPATLSDAAKKRLRAVSDGKGLVLVYDPAPEDAFAPFYAGDGNKLYAQRVFGGGRDGTSFDTVFWEPRVTERWRAGFGVKDGKAWLQCGDQKLALSPIALSPKARFFQPRFQRHLVAAARADDGTYIVVDQALKPERNHDYRLHVGKPGAFRTFAVGDAVLDAHGQIYASDAGTLTLDAEKGATFGAGSGKVKVRALDVEDVAADVYGRLGVYTEPLGSACDRFLAATK